MRRCYRRNIALLGLLFWGCALKKHTTLKLKGVSPSYEYQEQPNPLSTYPLLASKAGRSADYKKVFGILAQKSVLSQEQFVALQALRDSYVLHSAKMISKPNSKCDENFCTELYSELRRVFLDTQYDYRLRLKSLEYMDSVNKQDFPDIEVAEAVEVIATTFGNNKNTKDARKRAVLFIKKHNIM